MSKLNEAFFADILVASSIAARFDDYEKVNLKRKTLTRFFDDDTFNLIVYWMMTRQYECLSFDSLWSNTEALKKYLMIDHSRPNKKAYTQSVSGLKRHGNYKKS